MIIDQADGSDDVNDRLSQAEAQSRVCVFLAIVEISMTWWIQNQLRLVIQLSTPSLVLVTTPLTMRLTNNLTNNPKNHMKNHA